MKPKFVVPELMGILDEEIESCRQLSRCDPLARKAALEWVRDRVAEIAARNLFNGLADSVEAMSDEQIMEECSEEDGEKTRKILNDALARYKKENL